MIRTKKLYIITTIGHLGNIHNIVKVHMIIILLDTGRKDILTTENVARLTKQKTLGQLTIDNNLYNT
jgi:hypothetical protein